MPQALEGLRIVSFESRRAQDLAQLIQKYGGEPVRAPSLQEVPLSQQTAALDFGEILLGGQCDLLVLLTGVGTTMLVDVLATTWPREDVIRAMGATRLVCRGPKPVAALKKLRLRPTLTVPEPNTWRDLLAALDAELPVTDKHVAVQEYGARNPDLLDGLRKRGAQVTPIPLYAWALPDDTAPLEAAIERAIEGSIDVALFTSAIQVEHLFQLARQVGVEEKLQGALQTGILVASIGPTTSEALTRYGIDTDLAPEHPKMGHLIAKVAQDARPALERKRAAG